MNFFDHVDTGDVDTYHKPKFLDIYFYNHLIIGTLAYFVLHKMFKFSINKSLIIWIIVHTIYEIKDFYSTYIKKYKVRPTRDNKLNGFFHSDNSFINSIGDTIAAIIGFYLLYFIKNKSLRLVFLVLVIIYIIYMSNTHFLDDFIYIKSII